MPQILPTSSDQKPLRQHHLRRHPAQGAAALRYLAAFHARLDRVVLKALGQPGRPEYRVPVVGRIENHSLLTACPMAHGLPQVKPGEALEVRLFAVRDLVIFQSEVLAQSSFPAPYLHLAWPVELCVVQVRSSTRVQIDKPATFGLRIDQEVLPVSGSLVDLSPTGAAFLCDALGAMQGDEGDLVLMLEVDPRLPPVYVHPRCVIRSVREPLHPGGCLQYGLEFTQVSLHDTLAIRAYLGAVEARSAR